MRVGHRISSPKGAAKKEVHTNRPQVAGKSTPHSQPRGPAPPISQFSGWGNGYPTQGQLCSCLLCQRTRKDRFFCSRRLKGPKIWYLAVAKSILPKHVRLAKHNDAESIRSINQTENKKERHAPPFFSRNFGSNCTASQSPEMCVINAPLQCKWEDASRGSIKPTREQRVAKASS